MFERVHIFAVIWKRIFACMGSLGDSRGPLSSARDPAWIADVWYQDASMNGRIEQTGSEGQP